MKYENDRSFWDIKTDEKLMLDLCVLMLDHNYAYKRMIEQMHGISISVGDTTMFEYFNPINEVNAKY